MALPQDTFLRYKYDALLYVTETGLTLRISGLLFRRQELHNDDMIHPVNTGHVNIVKAKRVKTSTSKDFRSTF